MSHHVNYGIWNQEDLNSYFTGTYVGVEDEKGVIQPVLINGISRDHDSGEHTVVGRVGRNDIICKMSSPKMHILVPNSSYVNVRGQTVYCSRKTGRQYKKGVKREQYRLELGSQGDSVNKHGEEQLPMPNFEKEIIIGMFNQRYPSFDEAVEEVRGGVRLSCAFSNHFAVAAKPSIENTVLMYKGLVCGQVIGDRVELCDGFTDLQEKLVELMG